MQAPQTWARKYGPAARALSHTMPFSASSPAARTRHRSQLRRALASNAVPLTQLPWRFSVRRTTVRCAQGAPAACAIRTQEPCLRTSHSSWCWCTRGRTTRAARPSPPPAGAGFAHSGACTIGERCSHHCNTQLHPLDGCVSRRGSEGTHRSTSLAPATAATPSHSRHTVRRELAPVTACVAVRMHPMAVASLLPQRRRCLGSVR